MTQLVVGLRGSGSRTRPAERKRSDIAGNRNVVRQNPAGTKPSVWLRFKPSSTRLSDAKNNSAEMKKLACTKQSVVLRSRLRRPSGVESSIGKMKKHASTKQSVELRLRPRRLNVAARKNVEKWTLADMKQSAWLGSTPSNMRRTVAVNRRKDLHVKLSRKTSAAIEKLALRLSEKWKSNAS
jgi:hypothetical protein